MKTVVAAGCAMLIAAGAFAQNYGTAVRRAKEVTTQTEKASQGRETVVAPPGLPMNQPVAPDPKLALTLTNIANLRMDFVRMDANTPPKPALTNDLAAAAMGNKPSGETIARFARDLQAAIAGNDKLVAQHQKLAQDVHALFNRGGLTGVQAITVSNDVQRILRIAGAPPEAIAALDKDIEIVSDETK